MLDPITCLGIHSAGRARILPRARSGALRVRSCTLRRPHNVTQLAQPNRIQKSTLDIRTHTKIAFRATYISTIWQLATYIQGFFLF